MKINRGVCFAIDLFYKVSILTAIVLMIIRG